MKIFLTIFAWWLKDPDPYLRPMNPAAGGPKTYGSETLRIRIEGKIQDLVRLKMESWRVRRPVVADSHPFDWEAGSGSGKVSTFWAQNGTSLSARCHFTGPKSFDSQGPTPSHLPSYWMLRATKALRTGHKFYKFGLCLKVLSAKPFPCSYKPIFGIFS